MCELQPKPIERTQPAIPHWLVFVNRAADDGPWLRLMVLNPFNGALCPMLNTPLEVDAQLNAAD